MRVVLRDTKERGRSIRTVLIKYNTQAKPGYNEFIKPTMKYADIVIPFAQRNFVAMDFVVANIKVKLKKMGIPIIKPRGNAMSSLISKDLDEKSIPNLTVCKSDITTLNTILKNILLGYQDNTLNK